MTINCEYFLSNETEQQKGKYIDGTVNLCEPLNASLLDTPLGQMIAIADENKVYLLEFVDRPSLCREIEYLILKKKSRIRAGKTKSIEFLERELKAYFNGVLREFETPLHLGGTHFQQSVWNVLMEIPYGKLCSYVDIASAIEKPPAARAVGNAVGSNQFAIVIPCHRVVKKSGSFGGYAGGLYRKKWLINHEKNAIIFRAKL